MEQPRQEGRGRRLKVILCLLATALLLFGCFSCRKTHVDKRADVTLNYRYGEENISLVLPDEEATRVIEILGGKAYDPVWGVPSCGFSKDVSLKVGHRVFAIACDGCNTVQDMGNLRFFDISQEEMEYVRAVFERHGGHFPCI